MTNIIITDAFANIEFNCLGTPTHYRVGETVDLAATPWIEFPTPDLRIQHALSSNKVYNLFCQVKNAVMESNIKSIVVEKIEPYIAINLKAVILDNGNASTYTNPISVVLQYDGTPTMFKYALNPVLQEGLVDWNLYDWTDFLNFPQTIDISGSDGQKNIYFLLKDNRDATSEKHASIIYNAAVAPTLNGATFDNINVSGTATITPQYTGTATEYSCEKNGQPLVWKAFNGTSFDLALDTAGDTTYSLFLKNQHGQSASYSIVITYNPPAFNLDTISINNGDTDTSDAQLSITFTNTGIETVTHYKIAQTSEELSALGWTAFTSQPILHTITSPQTTGLVSVYMQIKSNLETVSDIKSDSINFIVAGSTMVKVIGLFGGGTNVTYQDKTYCYSRASWESNMALYEFNSGELLTDWTIMNDGETELEFGEAGTNPGLGQTTVFTGTPYYDRAQSYMTSDKPPINWGVYVPNGTYNVSVLFSTDYVAGDMNSSSRQILVNGVAMTLPAIPVFDNIEWINTQVVVTNGKIMFEFTAHGNEIGFNGITLEKIG